MFVGFVGTLKTVGKHDNLIFAILLFLLSENIGKFLHQKATHSLHPCTTCSVAYLLHCV